MIVVKSTDLQYGDSADQVSTLLRKLRHQKIMDKDVQAYRVGRAKVLAINIGDSLATIEDMVNIPKSERPPEYDSSFRTQFLAPTWSIHISISNASILVDPNEYYLTTPRDSQYFPLDYSPPPKLEDQLISNRVMPENVTHVVITHRHFDHYAGVTRKDELGKYVPSFPKAKYFMARLDRESRNIPEVLIDPDENNRSLGVLERSGLLELVEGNRELLPGVEIISAPGETPGHQILRVSSDDNTLYCVGDLFHHSIEVEHPQWMASWADPRTNVKSRLTLEDAAISEKALVIAGHMPIGRIVQDGKKRTWVGY